MQTTLIAAASINLATAFIHTIAGHVGLIRPFMQIEFTPELMAILHGCWHMVTVSLFGSALVLFAIGLRPHRFATVQLAMAIGSLYTAFALVFAMVGIGYGLFLFQVLLLLPVGLLAVMGARQVAGGALGDAESVTQPSPTQGRSSPF